MLFYFSLLFVSISFSMSLHSIDTLYDAPVSNHGARIRLLANFKQIKDSLAIKSPTDIGGLKSEEYSKLSIQVPRVLLIFTT